MATKLKTVEQALDELPSGVVNIRGKQYQTVAFRVQQFREAHPDWSLTTAVMARDPDCVVMQATIADGDGRILATGHAEEYRTSSQINRTSALENAETSAIGRALAALGFGGTEFATANEVQNAIHQQSAGEVRTISNVRDDPFPQGPAKNKTQLKEMGRVFWKDVEACGDSDELECLLADKNNVALVNQLMKALPQWWDGGTDRNGEVFEGLEQVIARQRRDFEQTENA